MNGDPPPAVFSSYHFTSFEKMISSDLTGPGEGERRDGWSGNNNGRGLVAPPLPLPHAYLFSQPRRDAELFFFEKDE
jgi:hypothetical protein